MSRRSNPASTTVVLVGAAALVGVAAIAMMPRKKPKAAPQNGGAKGDGQVEPKPDPKPDVPDPPAPDPDADLPDCKFDTLIAGQVYKDARGTFFFVRPDQERVVVGTSPVDIRLQWGARQAAWSIVAVAGLAVGATAVIPAAFLGGAFAGILANVGLFTSILGSVLPSTVRVKRVGDGVVGEVVGPAGIVGTEKVPVRRCKNSVR
jgi:hypothetical protein